MCSSLFLHVCVPTIFFMNIKKYIIYAIQTDQSRKQYIYHTKDMIRNFSFITDRNS